MVAVGIFCGIFFFYKFALSKDDLLLSNANTVIYDKDGNIYSKAQFNQVQKYFSISQAGGMNQGFDFELSLDFKELMDLRSRLLDCRAQGRCPRR